MPSGRGKLQLCLLHLFGRLLQRYRSILNLSQHLRQTYKIALPPLLWEERFAQQLCAAVCGADKGELAPSTTQAARLRKMLKAFSILSQSADELT